MAILSTIIVGLVIGALGRLVVPRRQRVNLLVIFLAGLVGSIVGGFLGSHVLGLGWIGTTLVEIGVAAAVIAFMATPKASAWPEAVRKTRVPLPSVSRSPRRRPARA